MKHNNNIRALRKARKLTLDQLADQSGLSTSYLSRLEVGTRNLSVRTMAKLQKPLQAEPRDIVSGSGTSIDAELKTLPPKISRTLVDAFRLMIAAAKATEKASD